MRVITLGDFHRDIVLRRDRSSGGGSPARTRVTIDGRVAIVAAWVASLGDEADLIGARGDDVVAQVAAADLFARGVRMRGPVVSAEDGTVASSVAGGGGSNHPWSLDLTPADLDAGWFTGADVLHISGHTLLTRPAADLALTATAMARRAGANISVSLPAASMTRYVGAAVVVRRLMAIRPSMLFGSQEEHDELGRRPSLQTAIVKQDDGSRIVHCHELTHRVPAPQATVVDSTGMDEAFVAGFLLGEDLEDAIARGCRAGMMCGGRQGALPPTREVAAPASSPAP